MIQIRRIKTKEDLKDALCMIYEDMATFKIVNSDQLSLMSGLIDSIKRE